MAAHKVLTTAPVDASALALGLSEGNLLVVSLCAAWCDTCTEFRALFERIAAARPEHCFVWLDVEDDAALLGDIDVENFPTLAIYRSETPLHFGVSLPLEGVIGRLIESLSAGADQNGVVPLAVQELARQLHGLAATPDASA